MTIAAKHAPQMVSEYLVGYRLVDSSLSQSDPDSQFRAIRTVMADIRERFPETSAQTFRDARTMMNGWILFAFLPHGRYGKVLGLLVEAYLMNPLWILSADLRAIHAHKLADMWNSFVDRHLSSTRVSSGVESWVAIEAGRTYASLESEPLAEPAFAGVDRETVANSDDDTERTFAG